MKEKQDALEWQIFDTRNSCNLIKHMNAKALLTEQSMRFLKDYVVCLFTSRSVINIYSIFLVTLWHKCLSDKTMYNILIEISSSYLVIFWAVTGRCRRQQSWYWTLSNCLLSINIFHFTDCNLASFWQNAVWEESLKISENYHLFLSTEQIIIFFYRCLVNVIRPNSGCHHG